MEPIYVTGHKNPDTDSIVAAIAYAASELLYADYKEFHIAGHDLAISQITWLDSASLLSNLQTTSFTQPERREHLLWKKPHFRYIE